MAAHDGTLQAPTDILDIRGAELDDHLLKLMLERLDPDNKGPRALPTVLLYDGRSRCMDVLNFNSFEDRSWVEAL